MQSHLITNTHSALASTPNSPQVIVDRTREEVLGLFGASPDHFEVIFTSNATGGVKLLTEALSGHEDGYSYYYHRDCKYGPSAGRSQVLHKCSELVS